MKTGWNFKAIALLSLLMLWFDCSFYDISYEKHHEESDRYYPKERTTVSGPGYRLVKQNLYVGLFDPFLTVIFPMDPGYINWPQRRPQSFDLHPLALLVHSCSVVLVSILICLSYPKLKTACVSLPFRSYYVFLFGATLFSYSAFRLYVFLKMFSSDRNTLVHGKTAMVLPLLLKIFMICVLIVTIVALFIYRCAADCTRRSKQQSPKDLNDGSPGVQSWDKV